LSVVKKRVEFYCRRWKKINFNTGRKRGFLKDKGKFESQKCSDEWCEGRVDKKRSRGEHCSLYGLSEKKKKRTVVGTRK